MKKNYRFIKTLYDLLGVLLLVFLVGCNNTAGSNHPPVIVNDEIAVSPSVIKTGSKAILTVVEVEDLDSDPITYTWEAHRGKVPEGPRAESMIEYVAPNEPGDDVIKVTVSDGRGGVDAAVLVIRVEASETATPTPTDTPIPPTKMPVPPTNTSVVPSTDMPVLPTDTRVPPAAPTAVESLTGKIAFPVYDPKRQTYDIYLTNVDGSNRRKLVEEASEPAISPDGSRIAFRSWDASTLGLMVTNIDGTQLQRVSRSLEDDHPYWALRESLVFHSTKEGPSPRLYTAGTWEGANGVNNVQDVKWGEEPVYGQYPAWVPGGRIVYKYFDRSGNFRGLYVMNSDGSNSMPITDHPGDTMPSVSPRGDRVALMSDRTGKWEVYAVNIDGSGFRQLTDTGDYNSGLPTWSPDGNYIAFVSDRNNQWAVWVINADGSGVRKLFDLGSKLEWWERISWAP